MYRRPVDKEGSNSGYSVGRRGNPSQTSSIPTLACTYVPRNKTLVIFTHLADLNDSDVSINVMRQFFMGCHQKMLRLLSHSITFKSFSASTPSHSPVSPTEFSLCCIRLTDLTTGSSPI